MILITIQIILVIYVRSNKHTYIINKPIVE